MPWPRSLLSKVIARFDPILIKMLIIIIMIIAIITSLGLFVIKVICRAIVLQLQR